MMIIQFTALGTMLWLFAIALYVRPSYRRIAARNDK